MYSVSSLGTDSFRPLAYWPYNLLKRAAEGCERSLNRIEKEIAVEQIRREHYPQRVSRLHGIYFWESEEEPIRCESKWGANTLIESDSWRLIFTYVNLSRAETQWIDRFVLDENVALARSDLSWAHKYWAGVPWDRNPHWECLVEGRGLILGTALRMRALETVKANWPSC